MEECYHTHTHTHAHTHTYMYRFRDSYKDFSAQSMILEPSTRLANMYFYNRTGCIGS